MPDQSKALELALQEFGILPNDDALRFEELASYIDHLLAKDFDKLVSILYRMDVNEDKLKKSIHEHPEQPGTMIATLVIERQLQKIESRKQYFDKHEIPDEDRW